MEGGDPRRLAAKWYMGTVPTGVEEAAREEITSKLNPINLHITMGKVFVETEASVEAMRELRSVDRVFALALRLDKPDYPSDGPELAAAVRRWIGDEAIDWTSVLDVWRRSNEVKLRKPDVQPASGYGYYAHIPCRRYGSPYAYANTSISFRVSCTRTGLNTKSLSSREIAQECGSSLVDEFGWKVDLVNPALHILVYATDQHFLVTIPLPDNEEQKREYLRGTGLRPSIAYAMCRAASVSNGSVVLDPMCGRGTILLEGAVDWPQAHFIGGDLDDATLDFARENALRFKETRGDLSMSLFRWDATSLPLRDRSVDVVVSDIPYGKRHGTKDDNRRLYPELLAEFGRVLRPGGRIVILTTLTKIMERAFSVNKNKWTQVKRTLINNGGLNSYLFIATRKETPSANNDPNEEGISNRERKRRIARARQELEMRAAIESERRTRQLLPQDDDVPTSAD